MQTNYMFLCFFYSYHILFYIGYVPTVRKAPQKYKDATTFILEHQLKCPTRIQKGSTKHIPSKPAPISYSTRQKESINPAMTVKDEKRELEMAFKDETLFPVDIPVREATGKSPLMEPNGPFAVNHEAIPLLNAYATRGCPVDCGPVWTKEQIELLLEKGPHRSAQMKSVIKQLREETNDKIKHGYARVVKWGEIKQEMPKKLKISPVAMIPHKSKQFRCIFDLSFTLSHKGIRYPSVNETTNKLSKAESMVQLGLSLKRIVATMADNWKESKGKCEWKFAKLDIKDGFWRMAVNDTDAWNFYYVLPTLKPTTSLDEVEIVVPNSLQMG